MKSKYEVKTLIESDKEVQSNKHYELILEVDNIIQKRFPYGAINRVDVIKNQEVSDEELKEYFAAFSAYEKESDDEEKRGISKLADITQPLLFGNCGLFTNYAIGYLKKEYPNVNIECLYVDHHVALLIGRDSSSNSKKANTWGKDTIICDIWAAKSYLASNLSVVQKETKDIPFYSRVVDNYTNEYKGIVLNKAHYLYGVPEVISGNSSIFYDQMLMDWVEEDQKRITQPSLTLPKTPLSIKTLLDPSEIKISLSKLSKSAGWKFSQKQGVAWLECNNQKQAERITQSLMATKSVVVSLCKRQDNGVPTVKCEHFDCTKLNKLVSSLNLEQNFNVQSLLKNYF
ncbi:hypothetical protein [Legionella sp.]|uniref:hypothetical protein n=1 Tax=Legionella sp. TaxID=459 RepID=UPI003C9F9A90